MLRPGPNSRQRLNPRGNRKLNNAIHIAAICQLRHDGEEAIRSLKRRISDRVYRHLIDDARRAAIG